MEELKSQDIFWIVINPNGIFAGRPCLSFEEAVELANQADGRRIFIIDSFECDVTESGDGLI